MDSAAWRVGDDPVVGIVEYDGADGNEHGHQRTGGDEGDGKGGSEDIETATALESRLDARELPAAIERGDLETLLAADPSPSVLVACGESTLSAVARAAPAVPVLPVGTVAGIDTVDADRLPDALAAVLAGNARERTRPLLEVETENGRADADDLEQTDDSDRETVLGRALFDVTLVTDTPARISEFSVRSRGESVASFRADGVVVSTPAGSHGYASAIEGPQLSAAVDAVAVTPIAPFVTRTRRWVLPEDDVTFTVERDEGAVRVVVDERSVGTISVGDAVTVSRGETLSTLVVPDDAL